MAQTLNADTESLEVVFGNSISPTPDAHESHIV